MRKPFICGNWKLNKTIEQALAFVEQLKPMVDSVEDVEIGICAQFLALEKLSSLCKDTNLGIGAQNCYWLESGAFTGEIAPGMIVDAGCKYTIIGHSERREYFGETNETVSKKTHAAIAAGLSAIVCVGETLEQREAGTTKKIISEHLRGGLAALTEDKMSSVTIAYEPVWAIGTGKTATPIQAQEVHAFIRENLTELYSPQIAQKTRVQYGGSVKPNNVDELMAQPDIDGALVGGAALEVDSFCRLINFKR